MNTFSICGQVADLFARKIYAAEIVVKNGVIQSITEIDSAPQLLIMPGFVDAHIHIESSMLVPTAFAQLAVVHGTVATVSDPHEIANVCGMEGIRYMIENSRLTPFRFFFGAPSCVPATTFETAGATLDAASVQQLLQQQDIWYLSEMMNYPGVINSDPEILAKIKAAKDAGKPIDGHAPGLRGADARAYSASGITTDHECYTLDEAMEKAGLGMHILIREGSAAKNYDALHPLLGLHPDKVMFCSDDKHPDELVPGHINDLVRRSLKLGYEPFDVLRAACLNPVVHYRLPVGLLRVGDPADFIVVDNLADLNVKAVYIGGQQVVAEGKSLLPDIAVQPINNFVAVPKKISDFQIKAHSASPVIRVIEAIPGQLVTRCLALPGRVEQGWLISDTANDVLKISIINRYEKDAPVSSAFIRNFGLRRGALASTVAHDCHNIIVVGADDAAMCAAVNALITCKGGISVARNDTDVSVMPLPVAGLMSLHNGQDTAAAYTRIDHEAKQLGTTLPAPFMTLSFMALLVIPELKLSDLGLFDGSVFALTNVEKEVTT